MVGGGPAGRALAAETGRRGLRTTAAGPGAGRAVAAHLRQLGRRAAAGPAPDRGRDPRPRAGRSRAPSTGSAGTTPCWTSRRCARTSTPGWPRPGSTVRAGRAVGLAGPGTVALADGGEVRARIVVDAGGGRQPLGGPGRTAGAAAEQAAYGVVVDAGRGGRRWSPPARRCSWTGGPTTASRAPRRSCTRCRWAAARCCSRRPRWPGGPGLPMPVLRRRLPARLARHGINVRRTRADERVLFRLDAPRHRGAGVLGFGAAAPLVHPASGFSLATTLRLAPAVARAAGRPAARRGRTGAGRGPRGALAAGRARRAPAPPDRAGGAAADAAAAGAGLLRGVLRAARTAPLGLPHRARRPARPPWAP